ncbi:ABC transporter permease [Rhizobium bangladeshense]|uniref:ABC transporter permease n=1 Tax=Rhizobium bangladeshense TaxID=1138189 RepID=UPI001C8339E2|nr:ABC transporter permease [Rhizobium bangladeshense]MBX4899829.1 ABC transporter permease [Rhizobium bangladeshense]
MVDLTRALTAVPARKWHPNYAAVTAPLGAVIVASILFAMFVGLYGFDPLKIFTFILEGGFGSGFAWQDTLSRAAPLILVGLAVAIPAQAGMVIIGGEGALVLGGLAAAVITLPFIGAPPLPMQIMMIVAGCIVGAIWFGLVGLLRQWRGLNETITSLLLVYIGLAIFNQLVEGVLRDPGSLDKPSTHPIDVSYMLPAIPGTYIHIGLLIAMLMALVAFVFIHFTKWGFALRVVGGSERVARMIGLRVNRWIIGAAAAGGAMAGMAGAIEVAAVQGTANSSLHVGYGFSGILVAFLSRHYPLAVIPVSILIGGVQASGSLLQRRLGLPEATVLVFQGIIFVCVLVGDAMVRKLSDSGRS